MSTPSKYKKMSNQELNVNFAPIAIFACRRPLHLLRLLESLRKNPAAAFSEIYIFVGGPKKESDWSYVRETVTLSRQTIGFQKVRVIELFEQVTGSGLIHAGVSIVLQEHDRIICLEDDLEVRPDFLEYMNKALHHYLLDEKVGAVSGWNYGVMNPSLPNKAYLFPCTTSWGWATWRRSWNSSINVKSDFQWLISKSSRIHKFNFHESYNCLSMIERILTENYDAWDAAWYLYCFRRGMLTVFPNSSMIINRGFDGSGLNFKRKYSWKENFEELPQEAFVFPSQIMVSKEYVFYRKQLREWIQTFWPESKLRFFLNMLIRKRRQHINYFHYKYYF